MLTAEYTKRQNKLNKDLADFTLVEEDSQGDVEVYRHNDDERHVVVNARELKIVKRFRDGESSWSDAARFAGDYFYKHNMDQYV